MRTVYTIRAPRIDDGLRPSRRPTWESQLNGYGRECSDISPGRRSPVRRLGRGSTRRRCCSEGKLASGWHSGPVEGETGGKSWHYTYDRLLSFFERPVSCLFSSTECDWLLSGSGSGFLKAWDTCSWAEAATLSCGHREEPRSLSISSSQRWLVSVQPSTINVFSCGGQWNLECAISPQMSPGSDATEWCCAAFSPAAVEVDHAHGLTGHDQFLAALSDSHLCLFDYSNGWDAVSATRTHSLPSCAGRPTALAYTPCGQFMLSSYVNGQIHLWNSCSLALSRRFNAHGGSVSALVVSPEDAEYDTRFVSCGADRRICVWHPAMWSLEDCVSDPVHSKAGIADCAFSPDGCWLVSVSKDIRVWSVTVDPLGQVSLGIHQRLSAVGGGDSLCSVRFACDGSDSVIVGGFDGSLGFWSRRTGSPPDPRDCEEAAAPQPVASSRARTNILPESEGVHLRPMRRVTTVDSSALRPVVQSGPSGWFHRMAAVRTLPTSASSDGREASPSACMAPRRGSTTSGPMAQSNSATELGRWASRSHNPNVVLGSGRVDVARERWEAAPSSRPISAQPPMPDGDARWRSQREVEAARRGLLPFAGRSAGQRRALPELARTPSLSRDPTPSPSHALDRTEARE